LLHKGGRLDIAQAAETSGVIELNLSIRAARAAATSPVLPESWMTVVELKTAQSPGVMGPMTVTVTVAVTVLCAGTSHTHRNKIAKEHSPRTIFLSMSKKTAAQRPPAKTEARPQKRCPE
jgi:hypothetical protein